MVKNIFYQWNTLDENTRRSHWERDLSNTVQPPRSGHPRKRTPPSSGHNLKVPAETGFSLIKKTLRSGHPRKRTRTPIPRSQTKKKLSKVDTSSKNLHWKRLESSENGLKTFPSPFYQYVIYCIFTLLIYNWFGSGWICRQVIPKWKLKWKLWKLFVKTSGKRTPLSSGHQTQVPKVSATGRFHCTWISIYRIRSLFAITRTKLVHKIRRQKNSDAHNAKLWF